MPILAIAVAVYFDRKRLFSRQLEFDGVTVELRGGLGNQLFGWAAGFATATRLALPLRCDSSQIGRRRGHSTRRRFELGYFGISEFRTESSISSLSRIGRIPLRGEPLGPVFVESSFEYDPKFSQISGATRLKGYFQSFKYFVEVEPIVRTKLLGGKIKNPHVAELSEILGSNWTAVHVRRGDYSKLPDVYVQLSRDYYERALDQVAQSRGAGPVVVFSDSPEEARTIVPSADFMPPPEIFDDAGDLLTLMSQSSALVGANSTLSWWAGFMGKRQSCNTVFPSEWFTSPSLSSQDLLIPTWKTIPAERSRG